MCDEAVAELVTSDIDCQDDPNYFDQVWYEPCTGWFGYSCREGNNDLDAEASAESVLPAAEGPASRRTREHLRCLLTPNFRAVRPQAEIKVPDRL